MKTSAVSAAFVAMMLAFLLGMPQFAMAQGTGQDTLIVGVQNDTPNLHPWDVTTNSVWKAFLWRQWVYEGLYGLSPDGTIYPVLASSYTVGPDPMNVTVTLRTGVKFTDGVDMTADDVIFTFQTMAFNSQLSDTIQKSVTWQDPPTVPRWNASTSTWGAANPSHVAVYKVDATHVRFQLRQPYSMFFFGTLTTPIMPSHIWKDHLVEVEFIVDGEAVYVLPGGAELTQGTEFDFDRNFGSTASDVQATIGTGPWYLVQWTPLTSTELKVYDGYWGKSQTLTWQGKQWPFYPKNLRVMQFKYYGVLDVAILAMKAGEVHVVPWDLPTGFYNDLRRDPRMGFQISAADGFFFLAFNVRLEPMNDIEFRKAVAYCIDKDFIVDRLLAGFGIKGQAPMSPINPAYINSSATTPSFDLDEARRILNDAGYIDQDLDGWRDMPDGRPIRKTILTPAKDYDPVRADSGIMIANNLKAVGLNIDSSPTAFDAIVSAAFVSATFDMFVLGWVNLGPFPELYLFDFFGCASDVLLGVGSNAPGYCSSELEAKLTVLDSEMNDAVRIQAAKDAQGILTRDIPYDTLYSKRWIEGYRSDIWGGWISVNGEIFNLFSIGVLGAAGAPTPPTGPLTISLDVPGNGVSGGTTDLHIYAIQGGLPASGVSVTITASTGESATVTTGTTGYAMATDFQLPTVTAPQTIYLVAVATKDTYTGGDSASIVVTPPTEIAQLLLSTDKAVVAPGGTATVTAKVTDKQGTAIAGVPVEVIPELVLGTVTPSNVTTNAQGVATFTYTAPPGTLIPNRNQYDFVKASVFDPTKFALPESKIQTLVIGVENPTSDWFIVSIQSVTDMVIDDIPPSPLPNSSDVTVLVAKQDGTPVAGEDVTVTVSNASALQPDAATKTTNGAGLVTFTLTAITTESNPVSVDFEVSRAYFAMSGLSMLVTDGTTPGNATMTTVTSRYVNPNTEFDVTVNVYDNAGSPENGANVNILIPYNDMGVPVSITDSGNWTFIGYVGTVYQNKTDASGSITTSIQTKTFTSDSLITFETGIDGFGPRGAFFGLGGAAGAYSYLDMVEKRNKLATVQAWTMNPALMNSDARTANMTIKFGDLNGAVVGGNISVYRGKGDLRPGRGATYIGYYITDTNGEIRVQWTEPIHEISTAMYFSAVVTSDTYALGGVVGGAPFESVFSYLALPPILIAIYDSDPTIVRVGSARTYVITVTDFNGKPVQDATVKARVASSVSDLTDGMGEATLSLVPPTSTSTQTDVSEIVFDIKKGVFEGTTQAGTMVGVGVFALSSIQIPSASVGQKISVTATVTNNGPVRDIAPVLLTVDGQPFATQEVWVDAGGTATVTFYWVPYDTTQHTLELSVGISVVSGQITAGGAGDLLMVIGVGIVLLIIGLIIGLMMGRRPKGPKPEESMSEPEPTPEPEEPKKA